MDSPKPEESGLYEILPEELHNQDNEFTPPVIAPTPPRESSVQASNDQDGTEKVRSTRYLLVVDCRLQEGHDGILLEASTTAVVVELICRRDEIRGGTLYL